MRSSLVHVGTVGKPHGIRGEMKVFPETRDVRMFESLQTLFIGPAADRARLVEVASVRFHVTRGMETPLLKLKGFDDPESVSALRGQLLLVDESDIPLAEDEAFAFDVVGFTVLTPDGSVIGKVTDVLDSPAHDLYQIEKEDGSTSLVPGVSEFIREIDVDAGYITISPIEGLLD